MRNLKKVLALALATVMLLGMMAMASAKEYVDAADINAKYAVAIDVMGAIGALEGNPDGSFDPAGLLTRAQAAAIATRVALTRENADHVTAVEDPFTDVAMDNWAAGYVVAAKNLGLVDGMGDGTFAPAGQLKGYQFAKMLLCMLGYDAAAEGYLGSAWEYNVNKDARAAGLLAGLGDIQLNQNITREEAAQMAFNALFADMVDYEGGTSMVVNGVVIEQVGKLDVTGETLAADTYEIVKTADVDEFGYKYDIWVMGDDEDEIARANDYTVKATYADAATLTKGALYTAIGKATKAVDIQVYVNGADVDFDTYTKDQFNAFKDGTAAYVANSKGYAFELVKNDGLWTIMGKKAEIAKVLSVRDADAEKEIKRAVTVQLLNSTGDAGKYTFETEAYAKDDMLKIFVNADTAEVVDSALVAAEDVVFGAVSKVEVTAGAQTAIYVDGTKYALAAGFNFTPSADKYYFYLNNGYITEAKAEQAAVVADKLANYVYVVAQNDDPYAPGSDEWGYVAGEKTYYETQVVNLADGTVSVVLTEKVFANDELGKAYKMTDTKGIKTFAAANGDFKYLDVNGVCGYDFVNKVDTWAQKTYITADTKVLTIEKTLAGLVKETELVAAPASGTLSTVEGIIYTYNETAKVYEMAMMISFDEIDAAVVPSTDLYYVDATVLSTEFDPAANEGAGQVYKMINVYEFATGTKKTVKVVSATTGFYFGEVEDGVYTFEDSAASAIGATQRVATAETGKLYNGLLSFEGTNAYTDEDVSEVKFVDFKSATLDTADKFVAKVNAGDKGNNVTFYSITVEDVVYYFVTNIVAGA